MAMVLDFRAGSPHNLLTCTRRAEPRIGARWFVRTLLRFSRTVFVALGICILIALGLIGVAIAAHTTSWIAADGKHVVIPWTRDPRPQLTDAEQAVEDRLRTRDVSRVTRRKGCNCSLLFWKMTEHAGADSNMVNFLAGFNGCTHVSVDCCVSAAGGPVVIASEPGDADRGVIDGPQFIPLHHWQGRTYARVYLGGLLDCERLYRDLAAKIADPGVRHKTPGDWMDFALGRTDPRVVTCSGFIGECILRQPSSPLAAALRQAMKERITYGELTPNDLARAVAIEQAGSAGPRFERIPVLSALINAVK